MATLAQPDLIERLTPLFKQAQTRAVVVSDGESELGAIISMDDYKLVRAAQADRVMAALARLGSEIKKKAEEQGTSLEEIERIMLDRDLPQDH